MSKKFELGTLFIKENEMFVAIIPKLEIIAKGSTLDEAKTELEDKLSAQINISGYKFKGEPRYYSGCTKAEWLDTVHEDGSVTYIELNDVPHPFNNEKLKAKLAYVTASGVQNRDPGLDLTRHDPDDYPKVINKEHFMVIEDALNTDIIIYVGPLTDHEHHLEVAPDRFVSAKRRD